MAAPVSIKEVARLAGVSTGTVSNALNHPDVVAEPTKARVLAAIEELHFVTNASARQLRVGASQTVGVIVLDISNPFYTGLARGIEDRLAQDNLIMMMCSSDEDRDREGRFLRLFAEQQVLGLLVTPFGDGKMDVLERTTKTPTVLLDSESTTLPSISVNHAEGAYQAVKHLLDQGHRRIGFINGPQDLWQCRAREQGVYEAILEAGLDPSVSLSATNVSAITADAGRQAMADLLAVHPLTAVFCNNDIVAMGAMHTLRGLGLKIPQDVAVVGYDDIVFSDELIVPLTSVRQPMHDLGWTAADMLLNPGNHPAHVSFAPQLVVRETSMYDRG